MWDCGYYMVFNLYTHLPVLLQVPLTTWRLLHRFPVSYCNPIVFFFLTCDTIWWAKNHHLWPKLMPDHFQSSAVRPTGWDALQVAQQVNYVARESSEWCSTKLQGRMQTS
jgi:hypothetical protein